MYLLPCHIVEPWPRPCLKLRCAEGREFDPRPGQYSRMSFSSDQVTAELPSLPILREISRFLIK